MGRKQDFVYQQLESMIASGEYQNGDRLPNEIELAQKLQVSRVTLRLAMKKLLDSGLVKRSPIRSGGTFVSFRPATTPKILIVNSMAGLGKVSNPVGDIIPGIEDACRERHWEWDIITTNFLRKANFRALGIVGVILTAHHLNGKIPWLKYLQESELPVVQVHGFHKDLQISGFANVTNNFAEAWRSGLQFLSQRGHRKIAVLNNEPLLTYHRMKLSESSMRKIMSKYNFRLDWNPFFYPLPDKFDQVVTELFAQSEPPTAIYCYSDFFAMKLYDALARQNIQVPQDVAVLSMGGIAGAALLEPALSYVDLNYYYQGRVAVELLAHYAEWKHLSPPPRIYIQSLLRAQRSTEKIVFHFDA